MKFKQLWNEFMYDRTKLNATWDISCFVAAIAAFVLMFFVPVTTFLQWLLVAVFAGVHVIVVFFGTFLFAATNSYANLYQSRKIWGWCMLASVILWMFPISVQWSLIPIGLGILTELSIEEDNLQLGQTFLNVLILSILFLYTQYNIDKKLYLKSNPVPEVVVLSNYDRSGSVFFIEGQDTYLRLHGYKTIKEAYDLDLKKGDTVKILRHPDSKQMVIKIIR